MIKLLDNPSKSLHLDPESHKANEINLIQGKRPHMRAFHFSWLSFHVAFMGWFAIAPLLPYIKEDLKITDGEIDDSQITNVASTIFFRILVGPLCDRFGPKRVMSILLILGSIPVGLGALAQSPTGLIVVRFFIGSLGATFVPCQFWTTQMFNRNVVGSANALAGGWGNMGAGVTTLLMAVIAAGIHNAGLPGNLAWRVSLVIPAVICFVVGLCDLFFTDDCPQGDWSKHRHHPHQPTEIHKADVEKNVEVHDANKVSGDADSDKGVPPPEPAKKNLKSFLTALKNPNVLILILMYACCFGVELAVDGALTNFFFYQKQFNLTKKNAGLFASVFGLMNLFSRATGGFLSDFANEKMGIRGRMLVQFLILFLEGLFLFVFRFALKDLGQAVVVLVLFSYFTQAACGTSFGIVPFIDLRLMGVISGLIGGGGSIGGAIFAWVFKHYGPHTPVPFMVLGIVVMAVSFTAFALKVDGRRLIEFGRR